MLRRPLTAALCRPSLRAAPAAAARALCTAAPPPAPKPPAFTPAQSILQTIRATLPRVVTTGVVTHGEPIVYVEPKDVPIMLRFLRDHTGTRCKQLVDITAVDVPGREKRFEVRGRCARRSLRPSVSRVQTTGRRR